MSNKTIYPEEFTRTISLFTFHELRERPDWYFIRNSDLRYDSSVAEKKNVHITPLGLVTVLNSYVVWDSNYALYVPEWKAHISKCLIMDNHDPSELEKIIDENLESETLKFLKEKE